MRLILSLLLLHLMHTGIAQTEEVCPQQIPSGWVIISHRPCADCCGEIGNIIQMPTIQRIDNLPIGSILEICPQPIPPGWIEIDKKPCAGCCGETGNIVYRSVIKKINVERVHEEMIMADCFCCTDFHKQFDFWLGNWIVYDANDGKLIGTNEVIRLEDNCIINEHWQGSTGSTGSSYNYFDTSDSTWNQVWIDNAGNNLILKGKASKNKMVMKSKLMSGTKTDWYNNQITWTKNEDGTVTQLWEIYDKNHVLLNTVFEGLYVRR
ncbi:MAG: hypothetical protein KBE86_10500 [Chitinophagales bacterium]|nr:hypothetical protein [Chitinophagales bacterium]